MKNLEADFRAELLKIHSKLIDPTLIAGSVVGLIVLMSSLIRFMEFGWFNVFYVHTSAYFALLIITIFRKRIGTKTKTLALVSLLFLVGASAIFGRGIVGSGIIWIVAGGITTLIILGSRIALIYLLSGISLLIIAGYLNVKGYISPDIDLNIYVVSVNTWVLEILTAGLLSIMLYILVKIINTFLYKSIIAAKQNEHNIRFIINNISEGIIVVNSKFIIVEVNAGFANMINMKPEDITGKNINDFIPDENIKPDFKTIEEVPEKMQMQFISGYNKHVFLEVKNKIISYHDEKAVLIVINNITLQKEKEVERLDLIMKTEEKERSMFAKELHDGIGPILSTSKMYLDILGETSCDDDNKEIIGKIQETINDALISLKEISNNISPHILKNFGLVSAIQNFIEKHKAGFKTKTTLNSTLQNRLNEKIEISLYRVTIEMINNTLKYADASEILITLDETDKEILYSFIHNGQGFNYEKTIQEKRGMGLFNIQQRIEVLKGTYSINTSPDSNLELTIKFKKELNEQKNTDSNS